MKNLHKIWNNKQMKILKRRHFLLNCRQVMWIITSVTKVRHEPLQITWTNQALKFGETKVSSPPPSECPHSKQTSSCFLTQLLLVATCFDALMSALVRPSSSVNSESQCFPPKLRLRFLKHSSFFKGVCFRISIRWSIVRSHLCSLASRKYL